jgi:hypothetical protein
MVGLLAINIPQSDVRPGTQACKAHHWFLASCFRLRALSTEFVTLNTSSIVTWKGWWRTQMRPTVRCSDLSTCLEGLRKTIKILCRDSQSQVTWNFEEREGKELIS